MPVLKKLLMTTNNTESKAAVVFVHGDLQNCTVFGQLENFFAKEGHEIMLVNLPGHGGTPLTKSGLYEYFASKMKGVNNPIIVSHSSGSALVAQYLEKDNSVKSLVLINPLLDNPKTIYQGMDIDKFYQHHLSVSRSSFVKSELVDYSKVVKDDIKKLGLSSTHPEGLSKNISFYSNIKPFTSIYKKGFPILYIASKNDEAIPLTYHLKKAGMMKNSRIFVIDSDHHSLVNSPEDVREIVSDNYHFLNDS
jgi:pimeloyl-ACP methyl ester carboxylesterase